MTGQSRRQVTQKVPFDKDDLSGKLVDVIASLEEVLEEVPEAYRDTAEIEVGAEQDYDYYTLEATVTYKRPETDEEIRARMLQLEFQEKARRDIERREYERLKAKFE